MSLSFEQMQILLQQQQKQFEQSQLKLIETLTNQLSIKSTASTNDQPGSSTDSVIGAITEFSYDALSGVTFDSWFRKYEDLFRVDLASFDDARKVRTLLRKLGTAEHDRYNNFILPRTPRDLTFDETIKILSQIFGEQSSLFNIRFQCLNRSKQHTDDWVTYAGIINRDCERFKLRTMTEDQFKCLMFVCGLRSAQDADIRTRVLNQMEQCPDMTLQTITTECQRLVNLKHDTTMVEKSSPNTIQTVKHYRDTRFSHPDNSTTQSKPPSACWKCGEWHYARLCPFNRHKCTKCSKVGHKEECCRNKGIKSSFRQHKRYFKKDVRTKAIHTPAPSNPASRRKYVSLVVNDSHVRLQLDTASDITIISDRTWNDIGKPAVRPTKEIARSASGGPLQLLGEIDCIVTLNDVTICGTCFLTNVPDLDLLGLDWIEQLNLLDMPLSTVCHKTQLLSQQKSAVPPHIRLKLADTLQMKHATVFADGLGLCTKFEANLTLRPDARPVFRPKRPVPYAAQATLDQEIDRLVRTDVLKPVNYSSWAAPIVIVKKPNGTIRLCADFSTGLNSALEDHQYPLPMPDDLFAKLNGGKCFAKLDLTEAYLQVPVSEASKELLTINTHRGLFRYNRLPFGIKTAPAIFQQLMDTMLAGIPDTFAYLDDIIIMGRSQEDLTSKLDSVLTRISDYGFHLQAHKCNLWMSSIKYLGFIVDKDGRRPDPANISAIDEMPIPTDVATLRSFLGLVSYYSSFVPSLHRTRGPLNQLLTKGASWEWSKTCQTSFDEIKRVLTSELLLTHYDPSLPIVLASDASSYGIGAVIQHVFPDGTRKAIAHAARTLTPAEKNYSQIEKEALSIVFAVKRFHKMLYGRHFTLCTDHKPLLTVFGSKKGIPTFTATRLQRWAITLLAYDFTIQYQSTTTFGQADCLSRLIGQRAPQTEDMVIASVTTEFEAHQVLYDAVQALPVTASMIKEATTTDVILQNVMQYVKSRWPKRCPTGDLEQYYRRRESLSIVDDCIMFGERVVIPHSLRPAVLRQFHRGHPGINRTKSLARSYAYWPNMDGDLEQHCRNCQPCNLAAKNPVKCELRSWSSTEKPWQRLHVDFAGPINGVMYLILVDSYSKWPEVHGFRNATTAVTIQKLTEIFSCFGLPEVLVSDNGSQFTAADFTTFCHMYGIQHVRSPPYHPQSNGQAERFVDTFKRGLSKLQGEEPLADTIQTLLRSYRNTPNPNTPGQVSPAECIFGRQIRTQLNLMLPTRNHRGSPNTKMENQFNRKHGALPRKFNPGDQVFVRSHSQFSEWEKGTIERRRGVVLYEVLVRGQKWIRHANQIRPNHGSESRNQEHSSLQLDILLETFDLHNKDQRAETAAKPAPVDLQPRRWTGRRRTPIQPFQIDPRLTSYL